MYEPRTHGNIWVELSHYEFTRAWQHGVGMWQKSQHDGRRDVDAGLSERTQALGALAERAAAKGLGIYWPEHVDTFSEPDLGHNLEVKLIGKEWFGLRVYPHMPATRRVVGVVIPEGKESGPYRIPGWIIAHDGRREEWGMAPHGKRPMFAVPQKKLRWPSELLHIVASEIRVRAFDLEKTEECGS